MEHFRSSDGLTLAYRVDDFTDPWREAPVLLVLHSAMGSSRRHYAWVPRLARRYRVVRLDLRGHGESAVPPAEPPLTMARLVADAVDLLDHLELDAVHVIGNSAGGYIGQHLAMDHSRRVRSLALFGSTPGLKHTGAAAWLPRIAAQGLRPFLAETIAARFDLATTDPGLVAWFLDECARNDPAYVGRFIGLMTTLDWSERLGEIRCPTLVVVPGAETVGTTHSYDVMRERIPDAEFLTLEGLPHNICDAVPERCADAVLAFLARRFGAQS
jgi:pimeloyl-ACP methyl ester carboxylesterase